MNLAGLVDRYGRAIILAVTLLAGAAHREFRTAQHLSSPRVPVSSSSGTAALPARAMMLSVTRPLGSGDGGAGNPRVRSHVPRRDRVSAQFEPSSDIVVALQQVQGKIDDPADVA
jgi:hypothetical protein